MTISHPIFEILDIAFNPLDLFSITLHESLKVLGARITYELKEEGIADECEVNLWFGRLDDMDKFINEYVRCQVNMTVRYGYTDINTQEVAKFQIRGITTKGDEKGGYYLTIWGYSPILEANDKPAQGLFYFEGGVPMNVSEVVEYIALLNGWHTTDENGLPTVKATGDKPEVPYMVEQLDDHRESYIQFIQRLANMVCNDVWMRYSRLDGVPIIYMKDRNRVQDVEYEHEYWFNTVGKDPLQAIMDYKMDLKVTQVVENVEMASNTPTPLEEFNLDELPTTTRGADAGNLPTPIKGSQAEISSTERLPTAIHPILEAYYTDSIEELAELQMTTLGNSLARQGQAVWINNADMLTCGVWNAIKVVHSFDFDNVDYKTTWTLSKNTTPLGDKEMFKDNKDEKLQDFDLDPEAEKE